MAGGRILTIFVLPLVAASPAGAATHPATFLAKEPASSSMTLPGTGGYSVAIGGVGHQVTISVRGRDGTADYITRRRALGRDVHAGFGSFGRISVRFVPSGRKKIQRPFKGCRGRPRVHRFGTFAGTISFEGEHGYTRVRRERVRGVATDPMRWRCRLPVFPDGPRPRSRGSASFSGVVLDAVDPTRNLSFQASAFGDALLGRLAPSFLSVWMYERRGPVRIRRHDEASAVGAFTFDDRLTSADVVGPPPFEGAAAYRIGPDGTRTWTGDLSADLPGTERLSLAGPAFIAGLGRTRGD